MKLFQRTPPIDLGYTWTPDREGRDDDNQQPDEQDAWRAAVVAVQAPS